MIISIIIPVYNVGALLHKCVDSVINEIGNDCEIIIVDDGSTDNSGSICDEYSGIENIRIIHKTNGGLSSARNAGIEVAKGKHLLFLDSDDYLRPGSIVLLTKLVKLCGKFDFIQFCYDEVVNYTDKQGVCEVCGLFETSDRREMFERKLSLGGIGASACTKLISKDVFETLRFKEGIIHEDELFSLHLINNATKAIYITNPLYMYVQRPGSIITSKFSSKRLDIIPILEEQIEILAGYGYNDLVKSVVNKLFSSLCLMYVNARRASMTDCVAIITNKARCLLPKVSINKGTIGIIAKGMKMHLPMLSLYYILIRLKNG